MPRYPRGFDTHEAAAYLTRRDRRLGTWMKRIGPIDAYPSWRKSFDPVDALARAILYQQLSGKAAATIVGRVETAIGNNRFHCDTLANIDDAGLRTCGVSGNKALALRDLVLRESRGEIPDLRRMSVMHHDAIVDALVPIRGIGRWTVEMMLMFRLGRPDILPIDDLGIRKGTQAVDRSETMPTPKELSARGERWGPYRTYAALYLWRIADFKTEAKAPTPRSQGKTTTQLTALLRLGKRRLLRKTWSAGWTCEGGLPARAATFLLGMEAPGASPPLVEAACMSPPALGVAPCWQWNWMRTS